MTHEEQIAKNQQISDTKRKTVERHQSMSCKTFDVKVQENALSARQREALRRIFLEQKWYKNFILAWSEQSEDNKISQFDTKQTAITKKDKDMNDVPVTIQYLTAQSRQCLVSRMLSNMKTIKALTKAKKQRGGKLRFSSEETIIDLKQYGRSHKILSPNRIRIAGIPKALRVNGLRQFIGIEGIEFANARLIRRATGYYVQFVCYVPKDARCKNENNGTIIGVDFGCETSFTLSDGNKIDVKLRESDRLRRLQRELSRKKKGSGNFWRCVGKIRKEYQRLSNQRDDIAHKIVALLTSYGVCVIQDEQIKGWHKGGHGKAVQHSVLGRVKAKLLESENVVVLNRFALTTKLCTSCGRIHDELTQRDRTFVCDCGVRMDRDVHAAQNMVWFYENNVGVGRTDVKRVEMRVMIEEAVRLQNQPESVMHEAATS